MSAEKTISRRTLIAGTVAALGLRARRAFAIEAAAQESGLKDVFKTDFLIGTSIGNSTLATGRPELLLLDRYRGRVAIWDVVNEAIAEDGAGWRKSPWLEIMGPVSSSARFASHTKRIQVRSSSTTTTTSTIPAVETSW